MESSGVDPVGEDVFHHSRTRPARHGTAAEAGHDGVHVHRQVGERQTDVLADDAARADANARSTTTTLPALRGRTHLGRRATAGSR